MTPTEYKEMFKIIKDCVKAEHEAKLYKRVLKLIIKTLDKKFSDDVKTHKNPIGNIRFTINEVLKGNVNEFNLNETFYN